jgi:hypothetical protein
MATSRRSSRERGKSDRIDAIAVARAALAEGIASLPTAELAGPELDIRLLVDHRERDTCRQSSSAHTRSGPKPRAHRSTASNPRAPTAAVFSSSISPVAAATAASVCELLCMSAPSTIISNVPSPRG